MNVFNEAIRVLLFIIKNINSQTFYNTYKCAYKWMTDMKPVTLFIHGSRLHGVLVRQQHTKERRPNRFRQLRHGIRSRETSKYPSILPPRPERLSQWKIPMTPPGIEFATFRLVTVSQPTTAYPTEIQWTTEAFTRQLTTMNASVNRISWFPSPATTNGEFIFIT